LLFACLLFWACRDTGLTLIGSVWAQALPGGGSPGTGSNVSQTRHNLSSSSPTRQTTSGNTATTEAVVSGATGDICGFCHTPHAAQTTGQGRPPLNRKLPGPPDTATTSSIRRATGPTWRPGTALPAAPSAPGVCR